jgi:hypothetical protein
LKDILKEFPKDGYELNYLMGMEKFGIESYEEFVGLQRSIVDELSADMIESISCLRKLMHGTLTVVDPDTENMYPARVIFFTRDLYGNPSINLLS